MRVAPVEYLAGIPSFLVYFALALVLLVLFLFIYVRLTPYHEFKLIRAGNMAAATSLGGATIGFVLPLAAAIQYSVALVDMLLWAAVALVAQLLGFVIARLVLPDLSRKVEQGDLAAAIFLAALAISIGWLNAASVTY